MNGFTLQLFDSMASTSVEGVTSFVGEDESGSFGILPGHARMMTTLIFGLARYRRAQETPWQYLALPGAVLYYAGNILTIVCRHYLIDENYERISQRLIEELLAEERLIRDATQSLKRMEEVLLKQMWEMKRQGVDLL